ncbi:MAG: MCE family protein [Bryobacterales bacterium]|nr:MCE family protein [Bryobacterales bacterium]
MTGKKTILVGIFLAAGLLLFGVGLFLIGDRRLLFSESMVLQTEFGNVSGLKPGSKVRVSGMDAGEVLEVAVPVRVDEKFRTTFRVLSTFQPILRKDSIATIQTDGLVGNKFLQVQPGSGEAASLEPGDTVPSKDPVEFGDMLDAAVETVQHANEAIDDVKLRVDQAVDLLADVNKQAVTMIHEVGDDVGRIVKTANQITDDIRVIVENAKEGRGLVGKLLNDDELYSNLKDIVDQADMTAKNLREISTDLQKFSSEIKTAELAKTIQDTADNVRDATGQVKELLANFQANDAGDEGISADFRQTIRNAEAATAGLAENTEALKRHWLFRGFFRKRGFFDLDDIEVEDYLAGRFAPDRDRKREWVHAHEVFERRDDGSEVLTAAGRSKLGDAFGPFLRLTANNPLMIEGYADQGGEDEQYVRSFERASVVRAHLIRRFKLKPTLVGVMPMGKVASTAPDGKPWNGVAIVLFTPKEK